MDPRVVAALQRLVKAGRIMPRDVVAAAQNRNSPLHGYFEWDNTVAATRYRLQQAAQLIRRVRVEVTVNMVDVRVPQYILDPSADTDGDERRGYMHLDMVRSRADNARAALTAEYNRISQALRRAKTLALALNFIEDIEKLDDLAAIILRGPRIDDQPQGTA